MLATAQQVQAQVWAQAHLQAHAHTGQARADGRALHAAVVPEGVGFQAQAVFCLVAVAQLQLQRVIRRSGGNSNRLAQSAATVRLRSEQPVSRCSFHA